MNDRQTTDNETISWGYFIIMSSFIVVFLLIGLPIFSTQAVSIQPMAVTNLINNPSLEEINPSKTLLPLGWAQGRWGTNTVVFTHTSSGQEGVRSGGIQMTKYTSGDAKWYFNHVPVTPGKTYTFSNYYQSDVTTTITIEYKLNTGKFAYVMLKTLPATSSWTKYTGSFVPPINSVSATVFHLIKKVGYLNTDNFTLVDTVGTGSGGTSSSGTISSSGNTNGTGSTSTGSIISTGTIDIIPPVVSLTTPISLSTISGAIELRALATDNIGISGVNFFIDSILVGSGVVGTGSLDSYSLWYDSRMLTNGIHTVSAKAFDTANNSGNTANISVYISNKIPDTTSPVVSILSPTRGSILSGTSTLSISATDNIGITSVHYSVTNGTDVIVGELNTAPFTVVIPADALKNGSHTITAYATDAEGNIGNAVPVIYNTYHVPPEPPNPNLILNPSLESGNLGSPDYWFMGRWGANVTTFDYPVAGIDGENAARISMSTWADGDAKWYFTDVTVVPGATYTFSDQYISTVSSTLTVRYTHTDDTFSYVDIVSNLPASSAWVTASQTFAIPNNAIKITVFHLINSVGDLTIDRAELRLASLGSSGGPLDANAFPTGLVSLTFDDGWGSQYDTAFPMLNAAGIKGSFYMITNEMKNAVNANRVANPSLEVADSLSVPSAWTGVSIGQNNALFTYPVTGVSGGKATKTEIRNYTDGDARWQPDNMTVINGEAYNFTDRYISDVSTKVTVVYTLTNNSTQTFDLGTVPASSVWSTASFTFTPPVNTKTLIVYHRLFTTGSLTTDDYHIDIAQDYMNLSQIQDLYDSGHEVSAHTRTHPFLTQLSGTQAISEISGSRQDMIAAGFNPSDTFVYPYGDYNSGVIQVTKDAGYIGARSVDQGYNTKATNKYALMIQEVNSSTNAEQWESWTQTALKNNTWLILMFHQIDHQFDQYGATPEDLQRYINYLYTNGIPTVTLQQGIRLMNP